MYLVCLLILSKEENITELHLKFFCKIENLCTYIDMSKCTHIQLTLYILSIIFCWFPLHIDFPTNNPSKLNVFIGTSLNGFHAIE